MSTEILFIVGSGILIVLVSYVLLKTKRIYEMGEMVSRGLSLGFWVIDGLHLLLVTLASVYSVWIFPIDRIGALIVGLILLGIGISVMLAGMLEFRSLRRISGLTSSELVTTGIYQYSRNPQYLGWFLTLFGITFSGRSGLAFLLSFVGVLLFHVCITRLEEPYLERIFGSKYSDYKSRTARYLGTPKCQIDS